MGTAIIIIGIGLILGLFLYGMKKQGLFKFLSKKKFSTDLLDNLKSATRLKITKEISLVSNFSTCGDNCSILLDIDNKKWAIITEGLDNYIVFNFSQLSYFEILEDGNSVTSGQSVEKSKYKAKMLSNGIKGRSTTLSNSVTYETCHSMILHIETNDLSNSSFDINLIDKTIKKESNTYKNTRSKAMQIESILKIILKESDSEEE